MLYAALDIGGTKVMAGLIRIPSSGVPKILKRREQATVRGGKEQARRQIVSMLESLGMQGEKRPAAIGVAVPGPLDIKRGVLIRAPNLPGWENMPLRSWFEKRFKLPAVVENDANAAALAEALWGAGRGKRRVFYATISTGIGTGLVLDGKLYTGRTGMAMEGGHLTIDRYGAACACGLQGCIEAYASGTALARRACLYYPDHPQKCKPEALERAAAKGDKIAQGLIRETAQYLAIWLGNIINLLDPDMIVLGGGLIHFGAPFLNVIRKSTPAHSINPFAHQVPIVPASFKRQVGILGAAAAAFSTRN